ncbi:MAG: DUF5996 family protein [Chloroflexota bacterium]
MTAFPKLDLAVWEATRDTIHIYTRLIGKIRQDLAEPLEKWWHVSVHVNEHGLSIPPLPLPTGGNFTLSVDLNRHVLAVHVSSGNEHTISLQNNSPNAMMKAVLDHLKTVGIEPNIDQSIFASTDIGVYDPGQADTYLTALRSVHHVFQSFKASLSGKTGPVQLWPHHFDLSLEWFSGREADVPAGEEGGDEQIGFGFSTGDEGIAEAYFYANPWPFPQKVTNAELPNGASWYTDSWQGGLLLYNTLAEADNPEAVLLAYLEAVQQHSASLMK